MAITITVNPSAKQAAYRPILFEATSNRNNSATFSVTGVTSGTGAKARYAITNTPDDLLVGDIITGSGFTGTATVYNVRQAVTVVNAAWVETDLDYSVVSAGTPILTRTNDNFKLKGSVYVFDQSKINIVSIAQLFNVITVTTSAAHGYSVGDFVLIQGTTDYNLAYKILTVGSTTTFTVDANFTSTQTGTVRRGTFIGSKRQSAISVSSVLTFRFNIANLLQSALSPDFAAVGINGIITPNANTIKWYSIYLLEEFDVADGTVKTTDSLFSSDSELSTEKQVVRATHQHIDTQSLTAFIMGSSTQRFLTNAPKKQNISTTEQLQLSFLANAGVSYKVKVDRYDLLGELVNTPNISTVAIIDGRGILPVNSSLLLDANYIIGKSTVALIDGASALMSETLTFIIDRNCYQNPVRLHFENYLGGFDSFTFTGTYKQINGNKKTSFKRDMGNSFAVSDRGETTLGIDATTSFEVWSRLLTRAEGIWLSELINSVNVFIQVGSDYYPVNILNTDDVLDDTGVPVQIKIEYQYSNSPMTLSN